MLRRITPAQEQTLSYLKAYIAEFDEAPTLEELRKAFGLSSIRSVTQRIEALEKKGLLKRDRFKHRNITVLEASPTLPAGLVEVPVIASAGCDAVDVYAQDEFGEYILIDKSLIGKKTSVAAIKAVGDSMEDAGIHNGDYVIVEVTDRVENDDRVVAVLGDMAVIKRYQEIGGVVFLHPENKEGGYRTIVVKQEDSRIFGKVISVIPGTEWVDDIKIEYYPDEHPLP